MECANLTSRDLEGIAFIFLSEAMLAVLAGILLVYLYRKITNWQNIKFARMD